MDNISEVPENQTPETAEHEAELAEEDPVEEDPVEEHDEDYRETLSADRMGMDTFTPRGLM